jgi:hypothetical protein
MTESESSLTSEGLGNLQSAEASHIDQDLVANFSTLALLQRGGQWRPAHMSGLESSTIYFNDARHDVMAVAAVRATTVDDDEEEGGGLVAKWRSKERLKTTAVSLVMALNIGKHDLHR